MIKMVLYTDKIILMDRTDNTAWGAGPDFFPKGTSDLPQATDPDMTQDGDMRPWRIRLELDNTGITGQINNGVLKLRIDENKTFLHTGPLLMNEDAKKKYLIEAYIIQSDDTGNNIESKRFRFQLGSPTIDVDKNMASILTITLQEIQYRMKEAVSAREIRFTTPKLALTGRLGDFNTHQSPTGIALINSINKLPDVEDLQQNYIPQSPQTISILVDKIFENLSEPQVVGGVFKDFYYDFDPTAGTLITNLTADEIGRVDSGVIMDPLSAEVVDAEEEQSASTDFVRFKNHVILRGTPNSGSLPVAHSIFSSSWEHAKLRDEWDVTNEVDDRGGTTFNYLKNQTVKITYVTGIDGVGSVVRYFKALVNIIIPPPNPATSPTNWIEDFTTIPKHENSGGYEENDVVSLDTGPNIRFYRAKNDIIGFTLNGFRTGKDNTDPLHGSELSVAGRLNPPDIDTTNWEDISSAHGGGGDIVTAHATTSYVGFKTFSPWTASVFDWEKNMIGLKSGSLIGVTGDTFVGLCPDWNMVKDIYDKQDITDQFETVTMKWVRKVGVNNVVVSGATASELNENERYHGQRVIVGTSPTTEFTDDYTENALPSTPIGTANNKVAEYDIARRVWSVSLKKFISKSGWQFSKLPDTNEFVTNLDEGNIYFYDGANWIIGWEFERINTPISGNLSAGSPTAVGAYAHPVKDVYKVKGFEGTPSNAIEFRYVWDTTKIFDKQSGSDTPADQTKLARLASRGAWLWFWNPFPRLPVGDTSPTKEVGGLYGGHGNTPPPKGGFTTLNTFNNNTDSKQKTTGWNNGLDSEDMGKINGISFRMKVGLFGDQVADNNDLQFRKLGLAIIGIKNIPMIFWAVDDFDRIWTKKFSLRRNNQWDSVDIEFGDLSTKNLYLPRWDELSNLLGIPLTSLNFLLEQREYTGVRFDWRFVRGWGCMYAGAYDEAGFYNGGIDAWKDSFQAVASQIQHSFTELIIRAQEVWDAIGNSIKSGNVSAFHKQVKAISTFHRQSTIAIDALHYTKELIVNSDDTVVENARTVVDFSGNENDYIIAKGLARGKRERLSFFPQFWHFRSVGDVRARIGLLVTIVGDRIPDKPSQFDVWNSGTSYNVGDKVQFNDGSRNYAYRVLEATTAGQSPTTNPELWENINQLAISSVKHIIDGTGYHMELDARRKFTTTGD